MSNCNCHTNPIADGSGQLGRYLKALDPSYAPIDDRSIEELLVFAKRYAAQIRFYDVPEETPAQLNTVTQAAKAKQPKPDSTPESRLNWREFLRRDMAVIAASIATLQPVGMKNEYEELRERLMDDPSPEKLAGLFALSIAIAARIDRWYTVAIPENPLRTDLDIALNASLREQMRQIMAYEEGFKFGGFKTTMKLDYEAIENDAVWGLTTAVAPDASIYSGDTPEDKLRHASLYADSIFYHFYNFLLQLIEKSDSYFTYAMESYPGHQPYMALFIAFLKVFMLAQEQMNGLTGRMLDYYYKEVLQLKSKSALPDKAHIVFELAKDVAEYAIEKNTPLTAGKDAAKKELIYNATDNLVVNQAKIKELKTIFIEKTVEQNIIQSIYARPVADSADGLGEPFKKDVAPKWPTFGKGMADVTGKKSNPCALLKASIENELSVKPTLTGFAIASPQLLLQGGNRIIALELTNTSANQMLAGIKHSIRLTAEEGWLVVSPSTLGAAKKELLISIFKDGGDLSTVGFDSSGCFFDSLSRTFYVHLPVAEKAIVAYDEKAHGTQKIPTPHPVMQVMLGRELNIDKTIYATLAISNMSLAVRVGSVHVASTQAVEITGLITNASTGKPIEKPAGATNWVVTVKELGSATVKTVDADPGGTYKLSTTVGKILFVRATSGFKSKLIKVMQSEVLNIELQEGEGSESPDASTVTIPSFFDGLKQLELQNDDGPIVLLKPFDPFTAYPKKGSAVYIGSNEIFNKSLQQLSIHIKHLSDIDDNGFDLNIDADPAGGAEKALDVYKVSVLLNRSWLPLVDERGTDFTEGQLSQNVIGFTKDNKGKVVPFPELSRDPVSYEKGLTEKTVKGYIQLQNNFFPFTTNKDKNTDIYQFMTLLALYFKVKDVSVSYYSKLPQLEADVDQFFHIYPFGVVESSLIPSNPLNNGAGQLSAFDVLDKQKDYLLVDAHKLLLPQYTYSGTYDVYNKPGKATTGPSSRITEEQNKLAGYWEKITTSRKEDIVTVLVNTTDSTGVVTGKMWNNQYSTQLQEEGMLFIGLEKAQPLQSISILFQFAEGSAEDEDSDTPEIHWSYLVNNEWRPMRGEDIIYDGTYGFQATGIVKINLPADATKNNTIISTGLHWLMASVSENSQLIPQLVNIETQAVEVVLTSNDNDPAHFDEALPAGTINKLLTAAAEISKVKQPFASFDGKHAEIGREFYTRVSERLRHKNRAINTWDYEHLVLDRFPSIYKVKCITHTDPNCLCRDKAIDAKRRIPIYAPVSITSNDDTRSLDTIRRQLLDNPTSGVLITGFAKTAEGTKAVEKRINEVMQKLTGVVPDRMKLRVQTGASTEIITAQVLGFLTDRRTVCCGPQVAPGHVLIIPIAKLKNRNAVNPLQPKTGRRTLLEIEAYLKKLVSPFVKVHAKNPMYEQVIVGFRVQFMNNADKGFYLKKLNDEIVRYLTPWAFDENAEVKFGQKIYASSIINFIEERDYVDFITDFVMGACKDSCCEEIPGQIISIQANIEDGKTGTVIAGVTIEEKGGTLPGELPVCTQNADGSYSLSKLKAGQTYVLKATGYDGKEIGTGKTSIKVKMYKPGEQPGVTEIIADICGCSELEKLIEDNIKINGEIAVSASGERILLVSAPQHVIIPFEAGPVPDPCQKKFAGVLNTVTTTHPFDPGLLNETTEATSTTSLTLITDEKVTKQKIETQVPETSQPVSTKKISQEKTVQVKEEKTAPAETDETKNKEMKKAAAKKEAAPKKSTGKKNK